MRCEGEMNGCDKMLDEKTARERSPARFIEAIRSDLISAQGVNITSPIEVEMKVVSIKGKDDKIYDVLTLVGEQLSDKSNVKIVRACFSLKL